TWNMAARRCRPVFNVNVAFQEWQHRRSFDAEDTDWRRRARARYWYDKRPRPLDGCAAAIVRCGRAADDSACGTLGKTRRRAARMATATRRTGIRQDRRQTSSPLRGRAGGDLPAISRSRPPEILGAHHRDLRG